MSDAKHTQAWKMERVGLGGTWAVIDADGHTLFTVWIPPEEEGDSSRTYTAIRRAIAAVNATDGMADPASEIERLKEDSRLLHLLLAATVEIGEAMKPHIGKKDPEVEALLDKVKLAKQQAAEIAELREKLDKVEKYANRLLNAALAHYPVDRCVDPNNPELVMLNIVEHAAKKGGGR